MSVVVKPRRTRSLESSLESVLVVTSVDAFMTLEEDMCAMVDAIPDAIMLRWIQRYEELDWVFFFRSRALRMAVFQESLMHRGAPVRTCSRAHESVAFCITCFSLLRRQCTHARRVNHAPVHVRRVYFTDYFSALTNVRQLPTYKHLQELALLCTHHLGVSHSEAELGHQLAELPALVCLAMGPVRDASVIVESCPRLLSLSVRSTISLTRSMKHLTRFSCMLPLAQDVYYRRRSTVARLRAVLQRCTALTALRLRQHPLDSVDCALYAAALRLPKLRFFALEAYNEYILRTSIFTNEWGSIRTAVDGTTWVECRGSVWLQLRAMLHAEHPRATARNARTEMSVGTTIVRTVLVSAPAWLFMRITAVLLEPLRSDRTMRRFDPHVLLS